MSAMTNYLENEILDHILGTGSWTMPTTVYLALFTAAPGEGGGGTEVSGNGYARQATAFGAASGGLASNSAIEAFTAAGGNWGTITHWALFDALTSGNMLIYATLNASRVVNDGDTLSFGIGEIDITAA